jgi:hypothetical protein
MIFKTRENLSDDTTQRANEPEDTKTAAAASEPEKPSSEATADGAVVGAFEAVGRVVVQEMETVRQSIAELETRLARRLESERASTTSAINDLRQDAIARIEALRKSQQKAITELGEQSKASVSGLRGQFEPALEKANRRAEEVKTGLEQILATTEKKLEQELQALTYSLSGVRTDLDRQVTTSTQVSTLLNNMADLFSDSEPLMDQTSAQAAPAGKQGKR